MSKYDDEFTLQMAPLIAEGYEVNPPAFKRILYWNHVLFQLHFSVSEMEKLIKDTPNLYDVSNSYSQHARLVAIIVTYARCYTQAGSGFKSLDAKEIFKNEPRFRKIHDRIMQIRHRVIAHTDNHELMRVTLAVKEDAAGIQIRHLIHPIFPKDEFDGYLAVMNHTVRGVTASITKQLEKLETTLGKPIVVG